MPGLQAETWAPIHALVEVQSGLMVTRLTSAMWCWPDAKCLLVAAYCFWIDSRCACACLLVPWFVFHAMGSGLTDAGVPSSARIACGACLSNRGLFLDLSIQVGRIDLQKRDFGSACSNCERARKYSDRRCRPRILLLRSNPPGNGGDQATSKQTNAVNQLKSFQHGLVEQHKPCGVPLQTAVCWQPFQGTRATRS